MGGRAESESAVASGQEQECIGDRKAVRGRQRQFIEELGRRGVGDTHRKEHVAGGATGVA